jgi:hypothetical protein
VIVSFGGTPAKMRDLEREFNESSRTAGDAEQADGYDLSRSGSRGSRSRSAMRQRAGSIHR